ncbi:hypothetical protein BKA83DRAFT_4124086 [Pisolithus microcarpus]|nr:hypothetical protein BKA83DRAFT_4124086 [Pisolithus microcarpus]
MWWESGAALPAITVQAHGWSYSLALVILALELQTGVFELVFTSATTFEQLLLQRTELFITITMRRTSNTLCNLTEAATNLQFTWQHRGPDRNLRPELSFGCGVVTVLMFYSGLVHQDCFSSYAPGKRVENQSIITDFPVADGTPELPWPSLMEK